MEPTVRTPTTTPSTPLDKRLVKGAPPKAKPKVTTSTVLEFYGKKECGTCRKAKAFLDKHKVKYHAIDIIENPPPRSFLEKWVSAKEIKKFLNTRADIYKTKNLGGRVPTKTEAIRLMVKDPNLIKRPLIKFKDQVSFGYDESRLSELIK